MSIHFKGLQVMTFASRCAGEMKELIKQAGGNVLEVTSYVHGSLDVGEVQRSYTSGGNTTTESFLYNYDLGADGIQNLHRETASVFKRLWAVLIGSPIEHF